MKFSETELRKEYMPIPKVFCSTDTGKPFDHCMVCNKFLLNDGTGYMIEKAIKQHPEFNIKEVIFEYALCMDCMVKLNAAMSEESKQRISDYFSEHINLTDRRENLLKKKTFRVHSWINKCLVKNTPISKSPEYQIMAQCNGKHLLFTALPFALSLEALDEMTNLLSEKSLGEMDDFIGKYFSGPPEVAELLRKRLIFI